MYNILSIGSASMFVMPRQTDIIGNSSATKPFPKFYPKDWLTERGKKQKVFKVGGVRRYIVRGYVPGQISLLLLPFSLDFGRVDIQVNYGFIFLLKNNVILKAFNCQKLCYYFR
jgi:hypothetical protein